MKSYLYGIDILAGIVLLIVIALPHSGCASKQLAATPANTLSTVDTTANTANGNTSTNTNTIMVTQPMSWIVWLLLGLNILSSSAAAIVATVRDWKKTDSNKES